MSIVSPAIQRQRGFTIVELLIVIVVVAILVAITVVAYNGVQDRTKTASQISAAQAYVKAIKLMLAADPSDSTVNGTGSPTRYCLGPTFNYPSGTCSGMGTTGQVNAAFNTRLAEYMGSSQPGGQFGQASVGPVGVILFLNNWFTGNSVIIYPLPPNTPCQIPGVLSGFPTPSVAGAQWSENDAAGVRCAIKVN